MRTDRASATTFSPQFDAAVTSIEEGPQRWPLIDARHRRRLIRGFPFSIYYRVIDEAIVIVAIAHYKRRPGYWRSR
jgi:hypothetical protein